MRPPRLLVLTDRRRAEARGRSLLDTVRRALDAGAPAILLREKDLPSPARRALAVELSAAVTARAADLLIASDPDLAVEVGATGVHLATADPPVATADPPVGSDGLLVGRSCHDVAEVRAADPGADYVTVSPVAASISKPGHGPSLGEEGLASAVAAAEGTPVLALGGVHAGSARAWVRAGAYGVAVLGAVMGADDPAAEVRALLDALGEQGP